MKKKFLSLMMAAAMVATTSVSAFADITHQILDSTEKESEITVTGNIANESGVIAPSTISVTVPTTATFTVFKNRDAAAATIEAPTITIKSDSEQKVQVSAYKFSDPTKDQITVVSESELESASDTPTNKHVSLKLRGKEKSVVLKSSGGDRGIFKEDASAEAAAEDTLLGTVSKDNPLDLNLIGSVRGDYAAPSKAISNTFTLVLKLRKADKN
ncbi:hypothetical protein [uncultured Clostridium sp.]|uniref:hypothetical protein n=1 Tax=uncultured Clostridium sp. TaxID=59620 RepID=UPI0026DD2F24|nr:hypothetical protein [uncultured Clostridium sp.]